jgi:hypothetical protein
VQRRCFCAQQRCKHRARGTHQSVGEVRGPVSDALEELRSAVGRDRVLCVQERKQRSAMWRPCVPAREAVDERQRLCMAAVFPLLRALRLL